MKIWHKILYTIGLSIKVLYIEIDFFALEGKKSQHHFEKTLIFAILRKGRVAERLGSALQKHLQRFKSATDLQI